MEEYKDCCANGGGKKCFCVMHHKYFKIVAVVLAIIIIFFAAKSFCGDDKDLQRDTIVVSGKGEVTVKPDIATISFSIMEENLDVSKASDAVNTKMAKLIDVLKADGIAESDIKTNDYSINPRYEYPKTDEYISYSGKRTLVGYDVTQSVTVKIRDLSKVGQTVTSLSVMGVTDMGGLSFTNDKYDDLVLQARDEAIKNARDEAKKLSKSLGVKLVKIVGYSEGSNYPVAYDRVYSAGVSSMKSVAEAVITTGENKISSNVSITYEIK